MARVPALCGLFFARRHTPTSQSRPQIPFPTRGVGSLYTESLSSSAVACRGLGEKLQRLHQIKHAL